MANRKAKLDPRVLTISDLAKEASLRLPKHYDGELCCAWR